MRISCDERDSGYPTYIAHGERARKARVLLNGDDVKFCITADEELGEILVYSTDKDGRFVTQGDEAKTEWRRGRVQIVMPEAEAA